MKTPVPSSLLAAVAAAVLLHPLTSSAGKLTYVPITGDADAQISSTDTFTSAVNAGQEHDFGGVKLFPLEVKGPAASANDVTVTASTGSLAIVDAPKPLDGTIGAVFSQALVNVGARDNSEEDIVLDAGGLQPGNTYHTRVYIAPPGDGAKRLVKLSFAGDGQRLLSTGFFDENDATTSPGRFPDAAQPYYIDYEYTWDGKTAPGVIVTQRRGKAPFALFAVTNAEAPASPVAAAPAPAPAQDLRRSDDAADQAPAAEVAVQSDQFYADPALNSQGEWVDAGSYGTVWHPQHVAPDWRPYTRGRWVYSDDCGWTWDSDEDFGWATYHYGRWANLENTGWCWTPGSEWAPAWVSWRCNDDYAGWAPLGPDVQVGYGGVGAWVDNQYGIGPDAYSFCAAANLGAALLADVLVPRERNIEIIQNTTNVTSIVRNNNRVFVGGPRFQQVNQAIARNGGRPVPRVAVRLDPAGAGAAGRAAGVRNGVLTLRAPRIAGTGAAAHPPSIARAVQSPAVDKGWKGVSDPAQREALRAKLASESKGARPGASTPAAAGLTPGATEAPRPGASAAGPAASAAPAPAPAAHRSRPGEKIASVPSSAGPAAVHVRPGQPVAAQARAGNALPGGAASVPPITAAAPHVRQGGGSLAAPAAPRVRNEAPVNEAARSVGEPRPGAPVKPGGAVNPAAPSLPASPGTGARGKHVVQGARAPAHAEATAAASTPAAALEPPAPVAPAAGLPHGKSAHAPKAPVAPAYHPPAVPKPQAAPHASAPKARTPAHAAPAPKPQPVYHAPAPKPQPAYHAPAPKPQPAYHAPAPKPQPAYHAPAPRPQPVVHAAPKAAPPKAAAPAAAAGGDKKKKK